LITYQTYISDNFHHWDYFFMGPAVGISHGRALGTDVFSQYGVGWPVLFACLSAVTRINYSTCAGVLVLLGTVYFVLCYLTLRYVLRDVFVSAAFFSPS
jgi:hypothetical protein